ncbi:MAG: two-component system, OmpR family, phosphate regulon sensor histidine kinase PhoR [Blastocatellia bacterium]|jgi:two-component system phosphate regulon sensor histidine kinase PhoR|nr:two-component system, OmpR family, phosphate regulon sensor histidine kinase PhoR [Blastocatellia bacterium]
MINYRLLFGFFAAAFAALVVLIVYFSGFPHWLILSVLTLLLGLCLGLLLRGKTEVRVVAPTDREGRATGMASLDFSYDLLDATVNEMREGLLVIDADMRVVASNRAARDLFSLVDSTINLRRLTELTRNPAIYDAFLDAVRGTERAGVKVETYGPTKRVFDLRVVPMRAEHGRGANGAVGVFFDVTRLERLELVRQEFLSNVSHELRTPLTSIMALAETLEAGAIDDQKHNRHFLSIIQRNAARMHRLIDDILELGAIEAGNVKVRPESVSLQALVDDVVASLSAAAAARSVVVHNLVDSGVKVFVDPHRAVQILTNLIENAIKFNREGGAVTIKHHRDRGDRISVADTGEGIPAHHLDRLFERFYRADRARSRELGGTGLGLAIVKHLVKAHGGEVTVESHFGAGTQFTIELPDGLDQQQIGSNPNRGRDVT